MSVEEVGLATKLCAVWLNRMRPTIEEMLVKVGRDETLAAIERMARRNPIQMCDRDRNTMAGTYVLITWEHVMDDTDFDKALVLFESQGKPARGEMN